MPGKKDAVADNYKVRNLPKNWLTWPDMVRQRLEAFCLVVMNLNEFVYAD